MNIIYREKNKDRGSGRKDSILSNRRRDSAITMLEEGQLFKYILVFVFIASTIHRHPGRRLHGKLT